MNKYTTTSPTRLRIFEASDGWNLDGADDDGFYTEAVARFDTEDEAIEARREFVESHFPHLRDVLLKEDA